VISIVLEKPYADIKDLLAYIRANHRWIRLVEFTLERSPRAILETLNATKAQSKSNSSTPREDEQSQGDFYEGTMDTMEAMYYISRSCENSISPGDFFPAAMGSVLEPFLDILGVGKFSIRPSPHCGYVKNVSLLSTKAHFQCFRFGVCLINTNEVKSVPFSRYIDFSKFYEEMQPLLPKLEEDGIGFWTARSIKKAQISPLPFSSLPSPSLLLTYLFR